MPARFRLTETPCAGKAVIDSNRFHSDRGGTIRAEGRIGGGGFENWTDDLGDACDPFPNDPCNSIGALPRSTASLAASQDNSCENWSGHSQPGTNLQYAVLRKTDLSGANLNGALLLNANFTGASLANASLVSSQIRFANLDGAIMTNADLAFSSLLGANVSNADMTAADLPFAVLTGATYNESTIFPSGSTYDVPPWGLDGDISPWNAEMIPTPEPSIGLLVSIGALGIGRLAAIRGRVRRRQEPRSD